MFGACLAVNPLGTAFWHDKPPERMKRKCIVISLRCSGPWYDRNCKGNTMQICINLIQTKPSSGTFFIADIALIPKKPSLQQHHWKGNQPRNLMGIKAANHASQLLHCLRSLTNVANAHPKKPKPSTPFSCLLRCVHPIHRRIPAR